MAAILMVRSFQLARLTPPIAFHVNSLIKVLDAGEKVTIENVEIVLDAGGVKAIDKDGKDLGTHQAFWFAWSQFYPETLLWPEI